MEPAPVEGDDLHVEGDDAAEGEGLHDEPQMAFSFDAPKITRKRRRSANDDDPVVGQVSVEDAVPAPEEPALRLFEDRIGLDIHLTGSQEAIANITGGDPDYVAFRMGKLLGGINRDANRRLVFHARQLDRLLCVARPHDVTLDAASLCVARALWAEAFGWRPLRVHRQGRRLLASSVRWPTGWRVVDAPWTAVMCLEALGVPLEVEDNAKALLMRKLADSGQHIAEAGLAGSAIMMHTDRPDLLEGLELPALSFAGPLGTGRYRMPLLLGDALMREGTIKRTAELDAAILKACAPIKPLYARESFPRQLYEFQAKDQARGMRILEHTGGVLLAGDMGSGKCQTLCQNIATPAGMRQIGTLEPGDLVLGRDGKPYPVTGVFPQGEKDIYRISFTDGTSVLASDEHLWEVHSPVMKKRGRPSKVMTTAEILNSGLRDGAGNLRWYIPMIEGPLEMDCGLPRPLPPYTLGALLGDGSFTAGSVSLCDAEGDVTVNVQQELRQHPDYVHVLLISSNNKDYRLAGVGYRNPVLTALRDLRLHGKRAWEKSIPDAYKYGPTEVRHAVLQGLLDTDGSQSDKRSLCSIEFTSTSEQLAQDVQWLVESLGGTARINKPRQTTYTHKGEKKLGRPSWRVSVQIPPRFAPFRMARKAAQFQERTKYQPTRGIVSIEFEKRDEAVCISVDSPGSLYVTEHAILTHNTTVSLAMIDHLDAWPLLVVAPLAAFSTWQRQIEELDRTCLLCVNSIADDAEVLGDYDCAVVSYDRLHRFVDPLENHGFAAIIADEIQRIRTPGSRRSRALRALAGAVPLRIGLSGTPVTNRPEDVLPLGAFLIPGEWKPRLSARDLAEMYPGEDPLEALAEHLGTMMVRRRMTETGANLPGRHIKRVDVPLSPEQRRALRDMEEEARADAQSGDLGTRVHIFARLQKMRQIVNIPSAAGIPGPNAKVAAAVDLATEFSEAGRKSVIFVADRPAWREVGQRLDELGIGWTGIWGSTSVQDRIANEKKFHEDESIRVFVGTLASCAESLTLSPTATVTIFASLSYSPSAIAQAAARTYRMNQTNDVDEIYLHANAPGGTLDDRMHQILEEKRTLIAQVVDRDTHIDPAQKVSMSDLIFLLTGERDEEAAERSQRKAQQYVHREKDAADADALLEKRKKHARATLYKRKSGEVLDQGDETETLEDWLARQADPEWLEVEEQLLDEDLDDEDDWEELIQPDED